jgi:hypothetical protein
MRAEVVPESMYVTKRIFAFVMVNFAG